MHKLSVFKKKKPVVAPVTATVDRNTPADNEKTVSVAAQITVTKMGVRQDKPDYDSFLLNGQTYTPAKNTFDGLTEHDQLSPDQQTIISILENNVSFEDYTRANFLDNSQRYLDHTLCILIRRAGLGDAEAECVIPVIQLLLEQGASLQASLCDVTALHHAADTGFIEGVKMLTSEMNVAGKQFTLNPSFRCKDDTALTRAAFSNKPEVVYYLLDNGISSIKESAKNGYWNVLYASMRKYHYDFAQTLMDKYPLLTQAESFHRGFNVLDMAISTTGQADFCKDLDATALAERRSVAYAFLVETLYKEKHYSFLRSKTEPHQNKAIEGCDVDITGEDATYSITKALFKHVPDIFKFLLNETQTQAKQGNTYASDVLCLMHVAEAHAIQNKRVATQRVHCNPIV